MYTLIDQAGKDDEEKKIKETFESKRFFTIRDLKQEIEMLNHEITKAEARKAELEAKISEASTRLGLKTASQLQGK